MSLRDPSTNLSNPPPSPSNSQHPTQQNANPPQILPSMSSILHPEPRHDQPNHDRTPYQLPSNYISQHPLWHAEQNPDAPPLHLYQPPINHMSMHGHPGPYLVANNLGMAVPVSPQMPVAQRRQIKKTSQRRDEFVFGNDESQKFSRPSYKEGHRQQEKEVAKSKYQNSPTFHSEAASRRESKSAIPISGLLSSDPGSVASLMSPTAADHASPLQSPRPKYSIRLRQQPIAARACGFGERDRRVIDPPPILQMMVDSPTSTREELKAMIRSNLSVVHCTLWDPIADRDDTAMPGTSDKRQQRRLMGTLVSSPFVGLDEHNIEGCFFTFPDLSVRTPGEYSLKFSLVVLNPINMRPGGSAAVQSTAMSDAFKVFNAKDFCGMRASTALTKRLKGQGCLISVKKGNPKSGGGHERDDDEDDDDDEEDDGEPRGGKRGKRPKR